jgi:hypothetical protein
LQLTRGQSILLRRKRVDYPLPFLIVMGFSGLFEAGMARGSGQRDLLVL